MKLQKRTIPIKRKRARPLAEVHKSLLHQATKALAKTVKLVKGFMIQKCSRKITDLKEPPEGTLTDAAVNATKLENELEFLQSLKNIDSAVFGNHICNTKLSIGNKELTSEVDQTIVDLVVQQSRIVLALKETETAIAAAVLKNNTLRADEQSRDAKKSKNKAILDERKARGETIVKPDKGLLAERKVNGKERKAAVFLDTLEDGSAPVSKTKKKVIERVKILKNLRNKQNRSANKGSSGEGGGHDRDVYMPMNKRSGGGAASAPSSSTSSFKRKFDQSSDSTATKKPKPTIDSHQTMAAMKVDKLEQCVTSGKDWKESGVHPSWAAKHMAKAAPVVIKIGGATQNKKITFD